MSQSSGFSIHWYLLFLNAAMLPSFSTYHVYVVASDPSGLPPEKPLASAAIYLGSGIACSSTGFFSSVLSPLALATGKRRGAPSSRIEQNNGSTAGLEKRILSECTVKYNMQSKCIC